MRLERQIFNIDGEAIVCEYHIKDKNAVLLHGAGKADRTWFYPIANELLKNNVGVVLFDFSGHGESTGQLSELSLHRRRTQAQEIINKLLPKGQLYIVGFSMGAQTVCDLLPIYSDRVEAILLCSPAIYTNRAADLVFGTPEFTTTIRENESWRMSNAPRELRGFSGRTVTAIGTKDEIIPKGVTGLLRDAAKHLSYKEYLGVSHYLISWLAENPGELTKLIDSLIGKDAS